MKFVLANLFVGVLLAFSVSSTLAEDHSGKFLHFVTAEGSKLYDGEEELRFISFNVPNLHLIEDNFRFTDPNPWRWPNEFEIRDALESIVQMGGTVVRPYVLSVRREGSNMGDHVFVRGPGEFNEEAYRVLDLVLKIAHEKGVRVMIPFVDNWHWWGGRAEYAAFRGKEPDDFWTDEEIIRDFEKTIEHTINRGNTYTGVAYRDDPTIFGWETGNELDPAPEWTRRITAHIKRLDPNHLVIDGCSLKGVQQSSLDDPNVDVITTHHYPSQDNQDFVPEILAALEKVDGQKPYFVGEFGFVPTKNIEAVLDTVIAEGISGALIWSLRFHNRDGGFYWHWEPAGGGIYKAYHWPGFPSAERYDGKAVVQLMRNKAFEIRGMEVPPREAPAAPHLLPIEDVGAISWQGAAGATGYDVHRATSADGPWKTVGENICDAFVQYRPLFNDTQVEVGQTYYYQVVAKNEAGESSPSNIVGPVTARWKVLVDEGADLSQLANHTGSVELATTGERRVQEDIHRIVLGRDSSVDYQVPESMNQWRVMLFYDGPPPRLEISASSDGREFTPCEYERTDVEMDRRDYAFSHPVLLEGDVNSSGAKWLRIAILSDEKDLEHPASVEISRVEIQYGGDDAL